MTLLPIVERELRVAARRKGPYWARTVAAGAAIFLGGVNLHLYAALPGFIGGNHFFGIIAGLCLAFCFASGPLFTCDVLSVEKREGTLGLLFLTDLHPLDIVLGKLAASSVAAMFGLLAALPVLSISFLMGGVSPSELARMALALCDAMFFSLAAGLLASAFCQESRSAFAITLFILFLFACVTALLHTAWGWQVQRLPELKLLLCAVSPYQAFAHCMSADYAGDPDAFWISLVGTSLLSWTFLVAASWQISRASHERPRTPRVSSWRSRWHQWNYGGPDERKAFRVKLIERNPVLWLSSRNRLKHHALWCYMGLAVTVWLASGLTGGRVWWGWGITFMIGTLLQSSLKWLMAAEATHRWVEDRENGTLELILTTPLTVKNIMRGHLGALSRMFGPPAIALVAVEIVFLILGAGESQFERHSGALALVSGVMLFWDLYTLAWVGAWLGLTKRRVGRAFIGALLRVIVLPWFIAWSLVGVLGVQNSTSATILWFVVCALTNTFLCFYSRARINSQFRALAIA